MNVRQIDIAPCPHRSYRRQQSSRVEPPFLALQTGNLNNSLRFVWNSPTILNGDYFDDQYTVAGCLERDWTVNECRIASYARADYSLTYTGIRNVTLSAHMGNLFNRRPPIDYRGIDESGGGVIAQKSEDVKGRVVRVTRAYKFK